MICEAEYAAAIKGLRHRTHRLEREGDYWSEEDKKKLEKLFEDGVGITDIAFVLQRTEPAIFQQIEKQDLYRRQDFPQRLRCEKSDTQCKCESCKRPEEACPFHLTRKQRKEQQYV